MARATGSYPVGHGFKSNSRYHGPLVKRLRHRPFTAVTGVRFSHGSPKKKTSEPFGSDVFFLSKPQAWYGITRQRVWNRRRRMASPKVHFLRLDYIRDFVAIPFRNELRVPYATSSRFHTATSCGFHTRLCRDSIPQQVAGSIRDFVAIPYRKHIRPQRS